MSSFRRKNAPAAPAASVAATQDAMGAGAPLLAAALVKPPSMGLKPSVYNSLGLVSSGHTQLDELLGGGLQLGTAILVGSDVPSNFADTLLSYGLAEALSMRQPCLLLTQELRAQQELLAALPYNRTLGQDTPGTKSHFCCSYDLSRQLQPAVLQWDGLTCVVEGLVEQAASVAAPTAPGGALEAALAGYAAAVATFVAGLGPSVGRVYLHNLHEILYANGHGLSAAAVRSIMQKFVLRLRVMIRSVRVVLVISALPEALPGSTGVASSLSSNSTDGGSTTLSPIQPLVALVDTAFTIDTFAGRSAVVPYEFKEFCGFLVVERSHHLGTLVGHRPVALRYGLKRDRRKLHVERLHLPPEESRAQGSAGTDARLIERSKAMGGGSDTTGAGAGAGAGTPDIGSGAVAYAPAALSAAAASQESDVSSASQSQTSATVVATAAAASGSVETDSDAANGSNAAPRQYKRLNLGTARPSAGGGGINISTFRKGSKASTVAAVPVAPGAGCGAGPGKDERLEF